MQSQASHSSGMVSTDGSILLDASNIDWRDRPADPVDEDHLWYSLFASLDDAELREVFGDFMVPANTPD